MDLHWAEPEFTIIEHFGPNVRHPIEDSDSTSTSLNTSYLTANSISNALLLPIKKQNLFCIAMLYIVGD